MGVVFVYDQIQFIGLRYLCVMWLSFFGQECYRGFVDFCYRIFNCDLFVLFELLMNLCGVVFVVQFMVEIVGDCIGVEMIGGVYGVQVGFKERFFQFNLVGVNGCYVDDVVFLVCENLVLVLYYFGSIQFSQLELCIVWCV